MDTSQLQRDLLQNVAVAMYASGFTHQPALTPIPNDHGIFDGNFSTYMNSPTIQAHRKTPSIYLSLLICHSFGLGVCVAAYYGRVDKDIDDWTQAEVDQLAREIINNDRFELALDILDIPSDHNHPQRKTLDNVLNAAMLTYTQLVPEAEQTAPRYLYVLMQAMYFAGTTMIFGAEE